MTDPELLELLQHKTPAEWTAEELALLWRRMRFSPEIREALAAHIEMDEYLHTTLGKVQLNQDKLLKAREEPASQAGISAWTLFGSLSSVLLVCLALFLTYSLVRDDQVPLPPAVVNRGVPENPEDVNNPANPAVDPLVRNNPRPGIVQPGNNNLNNPAVNGKSPAEPPQPPPWNGPTQLGAAPRTWEEIGNDGFPQDVDPPTPGEVTAWFGKQNRRFEERSKYRMVGLDGISPFLAPWRPDAILRIALCEPQQPRFVFYKGQEGLLLINYAWPRNSWAAFRLAPLQPNESRGALHVKELLATDDERNYRTQMSTNQQEVAYDLRFTGEELILSRGTVVLLRAPFSGMPEESFFQRSSLLRAVAMVPTSSPPPPMATERIARQDFQKPSGFVWNQELAEGASWTPAEDGSVELAARSVKRQSYASFPLPSGGPVEIVCELDHLVPGSRLILGESPRQPTDQTRRVAIGFLNSPQTGQLLVRHMDIMDGALNGDANIEQSPAALAGTHTWVKVIYGCGAIKCWLSSDGVHWARGPDPRSNYIVPIQSFGVMLAPSNNPGSIRVRNLEIRNFEQLVKLAPADLIQRAPLVKANWKKDWFNEVAAKKPADVDLGLWQRACAMKHLSDPHTKDLSNELARWLFEDSLSRPAKIDERFALLDELATVADLLDNESITRPFSNFYERIGRLAASEGVERPFSRTATALWNSPIWTRGNISYQILPESLARAELIELVTIGQTNEADQLCRNLHRANWQNPILDWAKSAVAQQLGKSDQTAITNPSRRHPLVEDISKEGFNVLAEFEAAINAEAYRDAAQVISSAAGRTDLGLLPDNQDKRLLLSLNGAIALAMHEHPELGKVLAEQFGPIANLRVKQAMAGGDATAVEAITEQFPGTEAATQAHTWLGDRFLSSGDAPQALYHFQAAAINANALTKENLSWRIRLSSALLGRNEGEPLRSDVQINGTAFSPTEFEELVAGVLRQAGKTDARTIAHDPYDLNLSANFPPGPLTLNKKLQLDGELGESPGEVPTFVNSIVPVDAVGRQITLQVVGDQVLMNNRFQVSAFNAVNGELKWRSGLDQSQGRTFDWPLTPMGTLALQGKLVARQLTKAGPKISAFQLEGGKLLWETRPNFTAASDPIFAQGELLCATAYFRDQQWQFQLADINPQNGEVRWERPLFKFREPNAQIYATQPNINFMPNVLNVPQLRASQIAAGSGMVVIVASGTVAGCDLSGNIRWIRRNEWMAYADDRNFALQSQQPPLIQGQIAIIQEPGYKAITAVAIDSGRVVWQHVLPSVRRMIGRFDDRLIVEIDEGLVALSTTTGKLLWSWPHEGLLQGIHSGGPLTLCATALEFEDVPNSRCRRELIWIDAKSGVPIAHQPLEDWRGDRPRLGPLVPAAGRLWSFGGDSPLDPKRSLFELAPKK